MEYFKNNDLVKLHKNKKTLIGGYAINTDTDNLLNNLVIPGLFYKINDNESMHNIFINSPEVVNESLHNRLLGLLNSNNLTKKNRKSNTKGTRRKRH